jgi:hypothetical protein
MGEKALEIDVDGGLVVVGAELKVNANSRVSHSSLFDYRMSMISCFPPAPPSLFQATLCFFQHKNHCCRHHVSTPVVYML